MLDLIFDKVREKAPYVHNITNYVTVNDCANILLACGASPIMADDLREVEEITSLCNSLVINIGTLNERTIPSMLAAGRKAKELKHPVILDPVGAGASKLRTETALQLLKEVSFTVIRGNASEIKTLYLGAGKTKGVDVDEADQITKDNLEESVKVAKELSKITKAVIVITGKIDIVAYEDKAYIIHNGHPLMSRITGSGCMLSAIIGALCAAHPEQALEAAAAGVVAMGICGELAYERISENSGGTAAFRTYLIDYMSKLNSKQIKERAKVEVLY